MHFFQEAWEVLDVIQPSEGVRDLQFFIVGQGHEVVSQVCMGQEVCRRDGVAYQEHSGLQMRVQVFR